MKVTQEKLPESQIGLEIEISAQNSQQKYQNILRELTRTSNIPGFRKGKVPEKILLQRFGLERIKAAVLEELIQESLKEAIEQEKIEFLGQPKLRSNFEDLVKQYIPGVPLTFSAAVDVLPEVELSDYHNISVKAEETVYDPQEVDQVLEERRVAKATLIPVENRPAQLGDLAVVDFQGRESKEGEPGEAISGVQGEDFEMELVTEKFIPGFVDAIVGMNPQESKTIEVTFPEDYPKEDLAGKPVIFEITLKELKEKELPELDDDFAQDVSEFETMAELRESLEKQYQEKAQQETKKAIQAAILADLVEKSEIDLPEALIEDEVNQILTQTATQIQRMGVDIKQFFTQEALPKMRENARPEAVERVKERLIIQQIAKKESFTLEEAAIEARMTEIKTQLADKELDEERLREIVTEELLFEKTGDWLQEKAQVELVAKGSLNESEAENPETEGEKSETEAENPEETGE